MSQNQTVSTSGSCRSQAWCDVNLLQYLQGSAKTSFDYIKSSLLVRYRQIRTGSKDASSKPNQI